MNHLLKLKKSQQGQGLVEFALVFPLLMLLILGMVEFGWILNGKITLTNAAREGARVAAIYQDNTKVNAAVIKASEASSLIDVGADPMNIDAPTKAVTVKAKANIKPIVGLFFKEEKVSLTAQAVMRVE